MSPVAKSVLRALLPHDAFMALRRWRHRHEPPLAARRKDLTVFPVQDHVEIRVYWAARYNGKGPAMNVSVFDEEILRFDCFGERDGHYHVKIGWESGTEHNRLYFSEPTVEGQVERSVFEVRTNLAYYIERHKNARVRRTRVEQAKLETALQAVEAKMKADIPKSTAYDGAPF